VKATREFYGDEKGVVSGQVISVTESRARQLVERGLAEEVKPKAAPAPDNKKAAEPANKAAPAPANKVGR
jgi:hypothetical protein